MSKVIQVFKPYFRTDEVLEGIRECLEKGWTGIGYKTEEFEHKWKAYTGLKNCHFLNSATSGLHLAIRILKDDRSWQPGDEIITTALTFVSTNHAILYEHLTPVFADVDKSLCLDPRSVEQMITKKTRAVLYVGMGGNAANFRAIADTCRRNNLALILDAAHMSGTKWKDTELHVGAEAECVVFSFHAVKNLPSADAGAICFKDERLDKAARKLSWLGISKSTFDRYSEESYKWRYDVSELGYKYHGNSVMAAICLVSLKYLDEDNKIRRKMVDTYVGLLSPNPDIEIIAHADDIDSSRHLFQIATESRDKLIEKLARQSVYCGVHYIENTQYEMYRSCKSDVHTSRFYSERLVTLPLHLHLDESDLEYVARCINDRDVDD